MPSPYLAAGAAGLGELAKWLGGGADRKRRKKYDRLLQDMIPGLQQGITEGDVTRAAPMLQRSVQPGINALAQQATARTGGASGITHGTIASGFNQAMAGPMAGLYQFMLQNNQANRRLLAQVAGSIAGG